MKISFIVPEIVRSGGIRVIFEYGNRLQARGHEVALYTPVIPFDPYRGMFNFRFLRYRATRGIRHLFGQAGVPANIFPFEFDIKTPFLVSGRTVPDADAVIATSWPTAYTVESLPARKGRKFYLVQDFETWNCNVVLAEKSYKLPLEKIVVSRYLKDLLKSRLGEDSTEVMIGVNYDVFYNEGKTFAKPPRILFMDHQLENKNATGAISTCMKLKKKYPEMVFRAFGRSMHHDVPDFIEFHSNLNDEQIRHLYCNSDIFIFPSLYEGFGSPPAEAMACKCAVVGNAVGALTEYAVNGETAIFADPSDPDGLFKGACRLADHSEELVRISLSGHDHIKKTLSWDRSVSLLEKRLIG